MERAILVTVDFGKKENWTAEERALELAELANSAGAKVERAEIVHRQKPDPGHFIGTGKAVELSKICRDESIKIMIFNK